MGIGEKIKIRREYLGMSQDELAKKVGYKSRSTVNKIEKGINDITQSKIIAFANALDTTVDYLMGINQEDRYVIGARITKLRKQKNKAIYEIANELGIDPIVLEQYENGTRKIPFEVLEKFASYYNVSVDEIMGIHVGHENKAALVTQDKELLNRYKRWQNEVGYEVHFTDEETGYIIQFAKLIKQMNNDESEQVIKYAEFLINQREK